MTNEFVKLQPQATELEELVLGAMMLEKDAVMTVLSILKAEMFYNGNYQHIYRSIEKLFYSGHPVDISTVANQLKSNGLLESVGGVHEVAQLTNRVGSAANVDYHSRIIYQKWLSREMIRISNLTIKDCYEDTTDILKLIEETAKQILFLSDIEATPNIDPSHRITKALQQIELAKKQGLITGIRTGLTDIDKITGGWQKQDLIVIAARPGAGKSALAIKFATEAAMADFPTIMFSLEMSETQIAMRELASEVRLKYSKLRKGEIDDWEQKRVIENFVNITDRKFFVDSSSKLSINILRTKLLKAISEKGIKLCIVDYLNLMEGDNNRNHSTADKISEICKELKRTAKQFNIPIILLAQLNRDVEKEGDKRPKLHHLKSSGAIEEYSDMVMLLYRPAYYQKENCDKPNSLFIDIAKHKQGATGDVEVYCEIEKNIISDLELKFVSPAKPPF
mgnify:CR=1 FL=1